MDESLKEGNSFKGIEGNTVKRGGSGYRFARFEDSGFTMCSCCLDYMQSA